MEYNIEIDLDSSDRDIIWKEIIESIESGIEKDEESVELNAFHVILKNKKVISDFDNYYLCIPKEQYPIFVEKYIIYCENNERYEECQRALNLLKKFNK